MGKILKFHKIDETDRDRYEMINTLKETLKRARRGEFDNIVIVAHKSGSSNFQLFRNIKQHSLTLSNGCKYASDYIWNEVLNAK